MKKLYFKVSFILIMTTLFGCSGGISSEESTGNETDFTGFTSSGSSSSSSGAPDSPEITTNPPDSTSSSGTPSSSGSNNGSPEVVISIDFRGVGQGNVLVGNQLTCENSCQITRVRRGSSLEIMAIPDENSQFLGFQGACQTSESRCIVDTSQDINQLVAVFESRFVNTNTTGFSVSDNRIVLTGSSDQIATQSQTITLRNNLRESQNYRFDVPSQITMTPSAGQLDSNALQTLTISASPCEQNTSEPLLISLEGEPFQVEVQLLCTDNPNDIDFSFERAYFNQSVPAQDTASFDVNDTTLISNRDGLLRVFVKASEETNIVPDVDLFWRDAFGDINQVALTKPDFVPVSINEGRLSTSYNALLDASFFAQVQDYAILIDSDNTVFESFETNNRFPFTVGTFENLTIVDVPRHDVTFVPIVVDGEETNISNNNLTALYQEAFALFPIEDFDLRLRDQPLTYQQQSSLDNWSNMLQLVDTARQQDGSDRFYHGILPSRFRSSNSSESQVVGLAQIRGRSGVSVANSTTVAHELGHNLSLRHAPISPCTLRFNDDADRDLTERSVDQRFPDGDSRTSNVGFDIVNLNITSPASIDIMGFCGRKWISQYSYGRVLNFRGFEQNTANTASNNTARAVSALIENIRKEALVVKGTLKNNQLTITSAVTDNIYTSPNPISGTYILSGYDAFGQKLFSQVFDTQKISHSATEHFNVTVLSQNQQPDATVLRVYDDKGFLITQYQRKAVKINEKIALEAARINAKQVNVSWNSEAFDRILVLDNQSGQLLTVAYSGNINVNTSSTELKIKYSDGFTMQEVILPVKVK